MDMLSTLRITPLAEIEAQLARGVVIAGTGHRPLKLGGYSDEVDDRLRALARAALLKYAPAAVISGMALGWDMALAEAAIELGIPLVAAVPFEGQERRWTQAQQQRYFAILDKALVHVVSPGGYAAWKMQARNEWMVARCGLLLALWDGSGGGTANCLSYANSVNCRISNLWRSWCKRANLQATADETVLS